MDRNMRHNIYSSNGGPRGSSHHSGRGLGGGGGGSPNSPPFSVPHEHNPHDELINYIHETWHKVSREAEASMSGVGGSVGMVRYYQGERSPQTSDFIPFDLEAWLSRRRVQTIKRQHHNS